MPNNVHEPMADNLESDSRQKIHNQQDLMNDNVLYECENMVIYKMIKHRLNDGRYILQKHRRLVIDR